MEPFKPYGWLHILVSAVSLLAWYVVVRKARITRDTHNELFLRRCLAISILVLEGTWFAFRMTPDRWNIDSSLPFHLCDFAWMACVWSLISPSPTDRLLHKVVVFWTLGLAVLGYLTPTVDVPPDDLRFWEFWLLHWMVLATGLLNLAAFGTVISWKSCRQTILVTLAFFIPVTLFNTVFDTPYFFSGKGTPDNPTPIDLLGDWPLRLVWMGLLVSAWFHLLTAFLRITLFRKMGSANPGIARKDHKNLRRS